MGQKKEIRERLQAYAESWLNNPAIKRFLKAGIEYQRLLNEQKKKGVEK